MTVEHADPIPFLDVQGSTDMVTRTELINAIRKSGRKISERKITYYATEGLIPKPLRVGSRAGAYPKIIIQLLSWILDARDRGVTIEAIRELLPVWQVAARGRRDRSFNVAEIELVARRHVTRIDANLEIPLIINRMTVGCVDCLPVTTWLLKDGQKITIGPGDEFRLGFLLTEFDSATNQARVVAYTQLVLPGIGESIETDPATIILGSPVGARICCNEAADHSNNKELVVTA